MKYKKFILLVLMFCLLFLFSCSLSSDKKTASTSDYSYNISSYDVDSCNIDSVVSEGSVAIEEQQAKQIALSELHLSENSVKFDTISLTSGDNPVYKVEVIKDNTMYTCTIDAKSGEVISTEKIAEDESSVSSSPVKKNGYVDEEYVKQLILARLDKTSSDTIDIKLNEDTKQYEGSIQSGSHVYSFTVNALTGEFVSWKKVS